MSNEYYCECFSRKGVIMKGNQSLYGLFEFIGNDTWYVLGVCVDLGWFQLENNSPPNKCIPL